MGGTGKKDLGKEQRKEQIRELYMRGGR